MKNLLAQPNAAAELRQSLAPLINGVFITKQIPITDGKGNNSIPDSALNFFKDKNIDNVFCLSVCEKTINRFPNSKKFKVKLRRITRDNEVFIYVNSKVVKFFSPKPEEIVKTISLLS